MRRISDTHEGRLPRGFVVVPSPGIVQTKTVEFSERRLHAGPLEVEDVVVAQRHVIDAGPLQGLSEGWRGVKGDRLRQRLL